MTPHPDPSTQAAARLIRRVVGSGAHLSYEQLEAHVDGRAEPVLRERIDTHVRWCARCAAELHDLTTHVPTLRQRVQPAVTKGGGWLAWLKNGPRLWPQLAMASVVGAVALTVVLQDSRQARDDQVSRTLPVSGTGGPSSAFETTVLTRLAEVSPEAADAQRRGDSAMLVRLLTEAASQGNATAASALGVLYAQGSGVVANPAAAERYWRQAAQAGNAEAQHNLDALRSPASAPR